MRECEGHICFSDFPGNPQISAGTHLGGGQKNARSAAGRRSRRRAGNKAIPLASKHLAIRGWSMLEHRFCGACSRFVKQCSKPGKRVEHRASETGLLLFQLLKHNMFLEHPGTVSYGMRKGMKVLCGSKATTFPDRRRQGATASSCSPASSSPELPTFWHV